MWTGLALIVSFVAGATLMFIVSEHYYKRIETLLQLRRSRIAQREREPIEFIDERQAEALRQGKPIRTEIRRS